MRWLNGWIYYLVYGYKEIIYKGANVKPQALKVISDTFSVAGQLGAMDMADVAQAGYKSVIINRPDFEESAHQPVSTDVMQAAERAGLAVAYQPVVSGAITQADVEQFGQLFKSLPKPVLAYCRSGARCQQLYELSASARDGIAPSGH